MYQSNFRSNNQVLFEALCNIRIRKVFRTFCHNYKDHDILQEKSFYFYLILLFFPLYILKADQILYKYLFFLILPDTIFQDLTWSLNRRVLILAIEGFLFLIVLDYLLFLPSFFSYHHCRQ